MASIIWIVALILTIFTGAYLVYGRYLANFVELDAERETPAHKYEDGQEYVPAKKPVLLGHHYSSIAGGAPVVGPITAALIWGWIPALLWVAIGNPLLGSVHDFVSLSGSIRHEGKSIGYIIGQYIGEKGKDMLLWFAFLLTILVVAVFALVIGVVFNAYPQSATASFVYIALALLFGVWLYQLDLPFIPGTIVFVAGVFASVWVGIQYPIALVAAAEAGTYPEGTTVLLSSFPLALLGSENIAAWVVTTLIYGGAASVLPVWVLLQPRDYLSSFLLYTGVGGALLAVIVGTFITGVGADAINPETGDQMTFDIAIGAWYGFFGQGGPLAEAGLLPDLMPLFPLLFITIACGTISGFHSLVSSGTTAKQLNKETDARLIGYGGMLAEGLLAAVALCAVAIVAIPAAGGGIGLALPNFATGGGAILTAFGIPFTIGAVFMALVLVSFLLTSMDTAVRLGRYMLEEIIGTPETTVEEYGANRYANTTMIVVVAFFLLGSGRWEDLWALFGGANQLLAAMALLTATVWIANWSESKQLYSTGGPMVLMVFITVSAFAWLASYQIFAGSLLGITAEPVDSLLGQISAVVQIVIILALLALALGLLRMGWTNYQEMRGAGDAVAADGGTESDD